MKSTILASNSRITRYRNEAAFLMIENNTHWFGGEIRLRMGDTDQYDTEP